MKKRQRPITDYSPDYKSPAARCSKINKHVYQLNIYQASVLNLRLKNKYRLLDDTDYKQQVVL
jgi:hypothetical protein